MSASIRGVFAGREIPRHSAEREAARFRVQFCRAGGHHGSGVPAAPTDEGADAPHQFADLNRLPR